MHERAHPCACHTQPKSVDSECPRPRCSDPIMLVTRARHMMRLATKGWWGRANGRAKAESATRGPCGDLPPAEGGADGGAKLPIKGSQQVMIKDVAVNAHVVNELGHVSALPGEHHSGGGLVNARDRRAHFIAGTHRLPGGAGIDLLARAKGSPQRGGSRVLAQDGDRVMNVKRCPTPETRACAQAGRGSQAELFTLTCSAQPWVPGRSPRHSKRLCAVVRKMGVPRISPGTKTLLMVPPCSVRRLVANTAPVGTVVTESDWCCHSIHAKASGKCDRVALWMLGHPACRTC